MKCPHNAYCRAVQSVVVALELLESELEVQRARCCKHTCTLGLLITKGWG